MAESNKKPAIRFAGFTDPWEQRELGELLTVHSFKPYLAEPQIDGNYEVIQQGDNPIAGYANGKPFQSYKDVTLFGDHTLSLYKVKCPFFVASDGLKILSSQELDGRFLFSLLERCKPVSEGYKRHYSILKEVEAFYPKSTDEQVQIGSYFEFLDNLITLHQRKYDKLKNVKKSCLEKMFPKDGENIPELRFAGFTDPWEQREFDGEVELFSGLTYSPNDVNEKGTFVLRSSNVKNGELIDADNVYVNSEVVNSSNVREGDIIVVVRNGSRSLIGKHAQIKRRMEKTVIGAFMTGIRSNQSTFINALLDTQQFNSEVEKNLGATINQITNGMFRKMQFMFPGIEEQDSIGSYFYHLDNLITLHQRELNKLQNIKKSCLEKMFV